MWKTWLLRFPENQKVKTAIDPVPDLALLSSEDRIDLTVACRLALKPKDHESWVLVGSKNMEEEPLEVPHNDQEGLETVFFEGAVVYERLLHKIALTPQEAAAVDAILYEDSTKRIPKDPATRYAAMKLIIQQTITRDGYSARDRVNVRRAAHVLHVSWGLVCQEEILMLEKLHCESSMGDLHHEATITGPETFSPEPTTISRAWTIVGFTVGGAVILTTAGFLIYPGIVHAVALSGQAVGGIAVATHATTAGAAAAGTAAAVATTSAVAVKASVVTAFGLGGAGLGAYRSVRRTKGCEEFYFRNLRDVEIPTTQMSMPMDPPEGTLREGLVVLTQYRNDAAINLLAFCDHTKKIALAIDNKSEGPTFELLDCKVYHGAWQNAPPPTIPSGSAGICVGRNKGYSVTGSSAVVSYKINPTQQLVVYFCNPRVGATSCGVTVQPLTATFVYAAEQAFQSATTEDSFYFDDDYDVKYHGDLVKVVIVEKAEKFVEVMRDQCRLVVVEETQQCADDVRMLMQHHRYVVTSVKNETHYGLKFLHHEAYAGSISIKATAPPVIPPGKAGVFAFTNTDYTLGSASGKVFFRYDTIATIGFWFGCSVGGSVWANVEIKEGLVSPSAFTFANPDGREPIATPRGAVVIDWLLDQDKWIVTFLLHPLTLEEVTVQPAVHLALLISGFLTVHDPRYGVSEQAGLLWHPLFSPPKYLGLEGAETYSLVWDPKAQGELGHTMNHGLSDVTNQVLFRASKKGLEHTAVIALHTTVLAATLSVAGLIHLPHYINEAADIIDNSYATLLNVAVDAGNQLAMSLLHNFHGKRPVSLVAYSCGTSVVLQCLKDLMSAGRTAVIENIFLLGSTIPADEDTWSLLRSVVCGRVVNVYSPKDMILTVMNRAHSFRSVAGLCRIRVPGVENVNVEKILTRHTDYVDKLEEIMKAISHAPRDTTLNPDEESPGLVVPYQNKLYDQVIELHRALTGKVKGTVCIINLTAQPLEYSHHHFYTGRWELTPPLLIEESWAGVFVVQNETRRSTEVNAHVVYCIEEGVFLVGWIWHDKTCVSAVEPSSRTDDVKMKRVIRMVWSLVGALPSEQDCSKPPNVLRDQLKGITLKQSLEEDEVAVVEVVKASDLTLQSEIQAMVGVEEWSTPADHVVADKESFTVRGKTEEWEKSFYLERSESMSLRGPITEVSADPVPSAFSHRLQILVRNQMLGHHLSFVSDHVQGRWKFFPARVTAPGEEFVCGLIPRKVRSTMEGFVVFRIVRSEDGRVVRTLILGFRQEWALDGMAECSVELASNKDTRILDSTFKDWKDALTQSTSTSEDEHVAVVGEVVPARNVIVCIIKALDEEAEE